VAKPNHESKKQLKPPYKEIKEKPKALLLKTSFTSLSDLPVKQVPKKYALQSI
jgi:hypothetical protein